MKNYFNIFHFCKNVYYYSAIYGNYSILKLTLHKRSNWKGAILTTKQARPCEKAYCMIYIRHYNESFVENVAHMNYILLLTFFKSMFHFCLYRYSSVNNKIKYQK